MNDQVAIPYSRGLGRRARMGHGEVGFWLARESKKSKMWAGRY